MSRKAWRSTMCLLFNTYTWFVAVLCTIFNSLPENSYKLIFTLKGKKGNITYRRLFPCIPLKNNVLISQFLLQKSISINTLAYKRIQVQAIFDKKNCIIVY